MANDEDELKLVLGKSGLTSTDLCDRDIGTSIVRRLWPIFVVAGSLYGAVYCVGYGWAEKSRPAHSIFYG